MRSCSDCLHHACEEAFAQWRERRQGSHSSEAIIAESDHSAPVPMIRIWAQLNLNDIVREFKRTSVRVFAPRYPFLAGLPSWQNRRRAKRIIDDPLPLGQSCGIFHAEALGTTICILTR